MAHQKSLSLWDFFADCGRSFSHEISVHTAAASLSFRELFSLADLLARALANAGVRDTDIVAVSLPNTLSFVPCVLALARLHATIALLSPKYGRSELEAIRHGVRPAFLLSGAALARESGQHLRPRKTELLGVASVLEDLALTTLDGHDADQSDRHSLTAAPMDHPALIKFTSGSTAEPKAIALSAANLMSEARTIIDSLHYTPADRVLGIVPLCHSYGFDLGVLGVLASGATLVVQDSFVPRRVLTDISALGITIFLGVPSMYRFLVDTPLTSPPDFSSIRYLLSCTAPLSPDLITGFHRRYRTPISQHYGASETGAVSTHVPAEVLVRPESVGVAMTDVVVNIVDPDGRPLPVGTEGEITVTSRAVAGGYVMGQPPGPSPFRKDACYWTGDRGLIDGDGFIYVRGRMDDLINVGGFKVSPYEVTRTLESDPRVREAAVVGIKDSMGETVVYAAVTLSASVTETELLSVCRARLADYKVPRRIRIYAELPRGPSGKIRLQPDDVAL
jgi:long-chain acyl-CoA synthetase